MTLATHKDVVIETENDIVVARQAVRQAATEIGFGLTDTTRIVTAASELARNVFKYAGTGLMSIRILRDGERVGVALTFVDQGPGISDLEQAMTEGFSTTGGFGMGLPGARRLMDGMDIESETGKGTTIRVEKWLPS